MIGRDFYRRTPLECARELIGAELVWKGRGGIIVETEAYDSEDDEACHTFFRPAARAFVENHDAGTAYVYLNYGVHWMFNVLVKGKRTGFVLIRALEPTRGLATMRKNRNVSSDTQLCSGPGKLTASLGINGRDHGVDLCTTAMRCLVMRGSVPSTGCSPRIGISRATALEWRYFAIGNPHVSGLANKKTGRPTGGRPV